MEMLIVPTIGFNSLYALVIIRLQPRWYDQCHNTSDGRVDCAPNNDGVSLE